MKQIEMHCHSTLSDGVNTPFEVIAEAVRLDLDFLTLTDHDCIVPKNVKDALTDHGIESCDSVEISARNDTFDKSLHLVSYAQVFQDSLHEVLQASRDGKMSMKWGQFDSLISEHGFDGNKQGFDAFMRETLSREPETSNKYDMSRYLYSIEANRAKMVEILWDLLQTTDVVARFYEECLKRWGKLYDIYWYEVAEYEPSVEKTVEEVVEKSGGLVSLAHPNVTFNEHKWGIPEFVRTLPDYVEKGVKGIEINTMANLEWISVILEMRERFGLILTFWSDCHRIGYDGKDGKHSSIGTINPYIKRSDDQILREIGVSGFDQNFDRFKKEIWMV